MDEVPFKACQLPTWVVNIINTYWTCLIASLFFLSANIIPFVLSLLIQTVLHKTGNVES